MIKSWVTLIFAISVAPPGMRWWLFGLVLAWIAVVGSSIAFVTWFARRSQKKQVGEVIRAERRAGRS